MNNIKLDIKGDYLLRILASRGFMPRRDSSSFIEFAKSYADEQGRLAQAIVQFDKPTPTEPELRLSGFVAIVQAQIGASAEDVAAKSPPVMSEDLFNLVHVFQSGARPRAVVLEQCAVCKNDVSEYFVRDGAVTCRTCKEAMNGETT